MASLSFKQAPILLLLTMLLSFGLHAGLVLNFGGSINDHLLWQAYLFNLLAAEIILAVMLKIAAKQKDHLGFIFMGGSLLKFLFFFLFFYPDYKADGDISTVEFAAFFVPYIIALSFKSFLLLKSLNQA